MKLKRASRLCREAVWCVGVSWECGVMRGNIVCVEFRRRRGRVLISVLAYGFGRRWVSYQIISTGHKQNCNTEYALEIMLLVLLYVTSSIAVIHNSPDSLDGYLDVAHYSVNSSNIRHWKGKGLTGERDSNRKWLCGTLVLCSMLEILVLRLFLSGMVYRFKAPFKCSITPRSDKVQDLLKEWLSYVAREHIKTHSAGITIGTEKCNS